MNPPLAPRRDSYAPARERLGRYSLTGYCAAMAKVRFTRPEIVGMLYPLSRYTNARFGLARRLPIKRGATWAKWFRDRRGT